MNVEQQKRLNSKEEQKDHNIAERDARGKSTWKSEKYLQH